MGPTSAPGRSTVTDGGTAHYGTFYGVVTLRSGGRPVLVVDGNCQAESLRALLDDEQAHAVRSPPVFELTHANLPHLARLLAQTSLLVSHPIVADYRGRPIGTHLVTALLPREARVALFPSLRRSGLSPTHGIVRVAGERTGRLCRTTNLRAVLDVAAGHRERPLTVRAVRAVADLSLDELRQREEAYGTMLESDLISSAGVDAAHTLNHPGNSVLIGVARRVQASLGLSPTAAEPGRVLLGELFAPLTGVVLNTLALDGVPRPSWTVRGEPHDDAEVLRIQHAWLAERPRPCRRPPATRIDPGGFGMELNIRGPAVTSRPQTPFDDGRDRVLLIVGDRAHGVTRLARDLARQPALSGWDRLEVLDGVHADWAQVGRRLRGRPAHLHVTDRLLGDNVQHAVERFAQLAAVAPVSITLHDLPQPSDGNGVYARRTAGYAAMAAAARAVVVNSEHERALWDEALAAWPGAAAAGTPAPDSLQVVPLPLEPPTAPVPLAEPPRLEVAVLGFLYPGKGHAEALKAVEQLPPEVGFAALGGPSPGHEDIAESLLARAATLTRSVRVTGYLDDAALRSELGAVAVPVAAHRHISASGSIGAWLAAGRRPIVPAGRYVDELEDRCPGALWRYVDEPGALAEACRAALEHPQDTWLAADVALGPDTAEVARRYAALLRGVPS